MQKSTRSPVTARRYFAIVVPGKQNTGIITSTGDNGEGLDFIILPSTVPERRLGSFPNREIGYFAITLR